MRAARDGSRGTGGGAASSPLVRLVSSPASGGATTSVTRSTLPARSRRCLHLLRVGDELDAHVEIDLALGHRGANHFEGLDLLVPVVHRFTRAADSDAEGI